MKFHPTLNFLNISIWAFSFFPFDIWKYLTKVQNYRNATRTVKNAAYFVQHCKHLLGIFIDQLLKLINSNSARKFLDSFCHFGAISYLRSTTLNELVSILIFNFLTSDATNTGCKWLSKWILGQKGFLLNFSLYVCACVCVCFGTY